MTLAVCFANAIAKVFAKAIAKVNTFLAIRLCTAGVGNDADFPYTFFFFFFSFFFVDWFR